MKQERPGVLVSTVIAVSMVAMMVLLHELIKIVFDINVSIAAVVGGILVLIASAYVLFAGDDTGGPFVSYAIVACSLGGVVCLILSFGYVIHSLFL